MSPKNPTIKLIDAARHYAKEPHQDAAWNMLQGKIPAAALSEFAALYRAAPAAKPSAYENTWGGVTAAARTAGAKYPELVAAQWALESDFGKAVSGVHNYFGLKGPGTKHKTKEFIDGKEVTIDAEFLDFKDLGNCIQYLVDRWYRDWKDLKGVNRAVSREDAAKALVSEGYATDPKYASKLIKLMDQYAPKPSSVATRPASISLKVAAEFQNDNTSGTGYRECFSSSCAMLARFHGKIGSDDAYNKVRAKFGDTTDANAQIKALASLGLKAVLTKDNGFKQLEDELIAGYPVATGWLHKGPIGKPSGGGHWTVAIGFTPSAIIHNDTNGEADMVNGGYISTGKAGAGIAYSRKNWERRWCCTDAGVFTPGRNGWLLTCRPLKP